MTEPIEQERQLELAFAPVHKRAFGTAVGLVVGLGVLFVTVLSLILDPEQQFPLTLLGQYFAGYDVSWTGALIGAGWGLFVGFVAGWFLAFARNLVLAAWVFMVRTRAELRATRDFLDHI
jgi:hypothetical protein